MSLVLAMLVLGYQRTLDNVGRECIMILLMEGCTRASQRLY